MPRPAALMLIAVAVLGAVSGCGAAPPEIEPTGVDGLTIPTPSPDPSDFVEAIDNDHLPLAVGSTWTYRVDGDDGRRTATVTVTSRTKAVQGVGTTVVHEVVRDEAGGVVLDTERWLAQDTAGNVWFFGQETTARDDDPPRGKRSWEAGVDGARAGLVMPAEPRVGDGFRQEYAPGIAEDVSEVISLDSSLDLALEDLDDLLEIEETHPLEPGLVTRSYYAPGIGQVYEEVVDGGLRTVELVSFEPG